MAKARIFATSDTVRIKTSRYDEQFVDDIKSQIPKGCRSWDPDDKVWEVMPEYLELLIEIARGHFDDVIVEEEEYDADFDYDEYDRTQRGRAKPQPGGTDWKSIAVRLEAELKKLRDEIIKAKTANHASSNDTWTLVKLFMTQEDFKALYRTLAKRYHPDITKDNGDKMKKLNELFDKLGGK